MTLCTDLFFCDGSDVTYARFAFMHEGVDGGFQIMIFTDWLSENSQNWLHSAKIQMSLHMYERMWEKCHIWSVAVLTSPGCVDDQIIECDEKLD